MSRVTEYRNLAAKFRAEAKAASLANERVANFAAAERWEVLADELERSERLQHKPLSDWCL